MFDVWNTLKQWIYKKDTALFFKEGEVLWIHLGVNIGDEEYGKGKKFLRPVLVIKRFNSRIFLGVPLTSSLKKGQYYFPLSIRKRDKNIVKNTALLSQLRVFDAKRIQNSFGTIAPAELVFLKEKAKKVLLS